MSRLISAFLLLLSDRKSENNLLILQSDHVLFLELSRAPHQNSFAVAFMCVGAISILCAKYHSKIPLDTNDQDMYIGLRKVEVDALFVYENVWLICEDTVKTTNIRDHIRTKNEAFGQIVANMALFIDALVKMFPEKEEQLRRYDSKRIKPFALYIFRIISNLLLNC